MTLLNDQRHLLKFFDDVSAQNFLYQDKSDFFVPDEAYEPDPGIEIYGKLFSLGETSYQLAKVYSCNGVAAVRTITRPENNSVFRINTPSAYTVDWDTGRVDFAEPPSQTELSWRGNFLTPVRLANQSLTYSIESNDPLYSMPGLKLVEVRESDLNFTNQLPDSILYELDLDLIVGSQVTRTQKISDSLADSSWHKSKELWVKPQTSYKTAQKSMSNADLVSTLDALWRASIGGAIPFRYLGKKVRCKSERLTLKAIGDYNFEIDSIELTASETFLLDSCRGDIGLL